MTGLGIHIWLLSLIGIRSAATYHEVAAMLGMIHIFGNAYRLASSGIVSSGVYGRFTLGFCRTLVAGAVNHLASNGFGHALRSRGQHLLALSSAKYALHWEIG
ncbi:hypothetical protein JQ628_00355 [Bradyrhizobium lablabi]|uniref:hypothetical protein n=1 Tax=Bradyrhizobium lablabi TaxID=722472 RepID=UPI001BA4B94A|nr:hypothetical protein [Bradyrhizobium lablabi]MBR1119945.1 hypothetical protein [Bradyrhizobium lablabi]